MLELFESLLLGKEPKPKHDELIDIVGNYSFYVQPAIQGFIGLHSSTIVIQAFEDASRKKAIDFSVKWSKILKNETYDMEGYVEKHYHLTPSDIDLKVRAAVSCNTPGYPGVAYIYYGKIDLDPTLVAEIEGMILSQRGDFKARLLMINGEQMPQNVCHIRVAKPMITLSFDSTLEDVPELYELANKGAFLPVEMNFEEESGLKVRIDNYSITDVGISMKSESGIETKYGFRFASRAQRDIFYIFLRVLRSIKGAFIEKLLNEYEVLQTASWSVINLELDEEEDDPLDKPGYYILLKHDGIRELLRKMLRVNRDLNQENLGTLGTLDEMQIALERALNEFKRLIVKVRGAGISDLRDMELSGWNFLEEIKNIGKRKPKTADADLSILADDDVTSLRRDVKNLKIYNDRIRQEIETIKAGGDPSPSIRGIGGDISAVNVIFQ